MYSVIDCGLFKEMLFMGAALLEKNRQVIDSLNVFPVPDGDTGTNMSMTMQRAVQEIRQTNPDTIAKTANALSMGALKGARGNSGVILSQIFRGFAKALADVGDQMTAEGLRDALVNGTQAAYKAVMKPKEGTMLTVSRMMSESVDAAVEAGADVFKVVEVMIESGEAALAKTPELLPVLKEAGVVDSGGMGLLTIYRGFKLAIDGEQLSEIDVTADDAKAEGSDEAVLEDLGSIEFGYCTEFFIIHLNENADEAHISEFRDKLLQIGDSVVVVNDADIIKVHVHSNDPGKVLQSALLLGELDKVKIENMREQNREIRAKLKASEKEMGVVAVSVGDGIDEAFKSLGVSQLISGGQTMNPSIDVIAQAIKKVNARNVFVLPNNSNIILAAKQAAEICECNVFVIPSKTVVQGITALMSYNPEGDVEANVEEMTNALGNVLSGSVTFAVRDTQFDGNTISANDIIGMIDGKIVTVCKDVDSAVRDLVSKMLEKQGGEGVVSLYYGEMVSEEEANALMSALEEIYPEAEFFVQKGGQPLYYYYISAE